MYCIIHLNEIQYIVYTQYRKTLIVIFGRKSMIHLKKNIKSYIIYFNQKLVEKHFYGPNILFLDRKCLRFLVQISYLIDTSFSQIE